MMKNILITGGAGFVGANLAVAVKKYFNSSKVVAFDNLHRKGSELNIARLKQNGVEFFKGDVRNPTDLLDVGHFDFLIECSAEPSVLAGKTEGNEYLIQTNLHGAINCVELCRRYSASMIFISTSRVYPVSHLLNCEILESQKRFDFAEKQKITGLSHRGVAENFPMDSARSLYGATKYAAEIMLEEYRDAFGIQIIINRCGVIAGPWQFGKVDQGIASFWTASHFFRKPLKYIGFGGKGKQVRDFLHIDDLTKLIFLQMQNPQKFGKGVYNVGGGLENSVSLIQLTEICQNICGVKIRIGSETQTRYADIPIYVTDNSKISSVCDWKPALKVENIINDIFLWISESDEARTVFEK